MFRVARQIFRFRGLLATLTARELKARYRGSVLGFLWSLANPLLLLAIYTFVFNVIFRPRVPGIEPYALFVVCGLFPWIWLATSALEGSMSLVVNSGLIRKAVFPAELLPMVAVLANGVHLLLAVPILAAGLAAARLLGYMVGGSAALLLPAVLALQLPMIAGLAVGAAALTVYFKDMRDLLANLLNLLFFVTPILYSVESLRGRQFFYAMVQMNPFTPFTRAYQQILFFGQLPTSSQWLQMALVSAAAWAVGAGLFERLRETLVETA
jgi:ABC-type polysaccharide/polyol phosphate export permease